MVLRKDVQPQPWGKMDIYHHNEILLFFTYQTGSCVNVANVLCCQDRKKALAYHWWEPHVV